MTFREVFRSLQEVFPQVDLRILKAVAIEHSNDVDAAVEFILYEVLPSFGEPPEMPYNINDTVEAKDSLPTEASASAAHESAPHQHSRSDNVKSSGARSIGEDLHVGFVTEQNQQNIFELHDEVAGEVNVSVHSAMKDEIPLVSVCTGDASHFKSGCLAGTTLVDIPSSAHVGDDHVRLFFYGEPEEVSLVKDAAESRLTVSENGPNGVDVCVSETFNSEANGIVSVVQKTAQNFPLEILGKDTDSVEYGAGSIMDVGSCLSESKEQLSRSLVKSADIQVLCELDANSTNHADFISAPDSSSVLKETTDPITCRTMVIKDISSSTNEYEEQLSKFVSKNGAEIFSFEADMVSVEADNQPSLVASRSAQVVSVDALEEFIIDAKNNKKILASAMDSVIDMMKEVELNEERAKKAKEVALAAGQGILSKVEELRQMLQHAKEANEMHSGEVYGERSILATEARELQSRLLRMSDERDKSLSIIEEIRQTLEERLAATQEELEAAEQEKLEKEELAHKAAKEQELVMETIVQESKKLQQEAEENSRLREFLSERGRIVDALQGEIAVICEDVILLKNRVDSRMPLSRSVSSNGSVASSVSSSHHSSVSSNKVFHPVGFDESPKETNDRHPLSQPFVSYANNEKEIHHNVPKMLADDDWEIFD